MTPNFEQPKVWGKEIAALQALSNTPQSENDLQSLVYEITSVVEEAKVKKEAKKTKIKKKKVGKRTKPTDTDTEFADSFQTPQDEPEPERPAERESPARLKRALWQNYLI